VQLILARILLPEDFGIVGTAIIVINFSQIFWDAGLAKALIQTDEPIDKAANVVFWSNSILGVIIYGLLLFVAPWIAVFYNSPASMPILRVMGIQVVLLSLISVQQALMLRGLSFRQLFWIRLCVAFVPALFSIPMAVLGFRAWALVSGTLAGASVNLVLFWVSSPWRPSMVIDWHIAVRLFRFGFWVIGESLLGWFMMWGDNLVVGKFLGVRNLGIYQLGWTVVMVVFGLSLNPFLPILYPTFSRLQGDIQTIRLTFIKVNRVIISISLPVGIGLFLIGGEMEKLFGAKWAGLGFVISIIGLMQGIVWMISLNAEIYRAIGRPDVNTKLGFLFMLYYLPAYLVGVHYGLVFFTFIRLVVAVISLPIHIFVCVHLLHVSWMYLWLQGKAMILATLVMAASVYLLKWSLPGLVSISIIGMVIEIVVGAGAYFLSLWLLDKPFVLQTISLVKKAVQ
jgi:O-antigen/teichoic acid export membrane protein